MERIRGTRRPVWVGVVLGVAVAAAVAVGVLLAVRSGGEEAVATPASTLTMETCLAYMGSGDTVPEGGPCFLTISDGSPDAVTLEWVWTSSDATRWQYRRRSWVNFQPRPWGDWIDLPRGCATNRACRLAGLPEDATLDFQVRAVGGPASNIGEFDTPARGDLPGLSASLVVGDGVSEWVFGDFVVTIPDGVRLAFGGSFVTACAAEQEVCISEGFWVLHFPTSSTLSFSYDGSQVSRSINPAGNQAAEVNAIFDQIVASIRLVGGE